MLNMKARRNGRRAFGLLVKSCGRTLLNEGPRQAKVSPFFQTASPFATPVVIGDENIILARYEENAKSAVIIY